MGFAAGTVETVPSGVIFPSPIMLGQRFRLNAKTRRSDSDCGLDRSSITNEGGAQARDGRRSLMTTVGLGGGLRSLSPPEIPLIFPTLFSPAPKTTPLYIGGFFKPLKTQPVRHPWTWSCITVLPFYGFESIFPVCLTLYIYGGLLLHVVTD